MFRVQMRDKKETVVNSTWEIRKSNLWTEVGGWHEEEQVSNSGLYLENHNYIGMNKSTEVGKQAGSDWWELRWKARLRSDDVATGESRGPGVKSA